ncbi:hypothetical protein ACI784_19775 [Geodermatophilus sp. SYSU D01186]
MPANRRTPSDLARPRRSRAATVIGGLAIAGIVAGSGALVLDDRTDAAAQEVSAVETATPATVDSGIGQASRTSASAAATTSTSAPATTPAAPSETPAPTTDAPAPTAAPTTAASRGASSAASRVASSAAPAPVASAAAPAPATSRSTPAPAPKPAAAPAPAPAATGAGEREIQAYMTGYSYFDNTPAGSPSISHPIVHRQAGGTGTYEDPITVAVGHSKAGGQDTLDWPAGTRFYVPALSRYLIVEDTCGDGAAPQNGACHTGYPSSASTWLDVWVDGRDGGSSSADSCMGRLTGVRTVIVDAGPGRPVTAGPIASGSGCAL